MQQDIGKVKSKRVEAPYRVIEKIGKSNDGAIGYFS
jgi:hypothetical protein